MGILKFHVCTTMNKAGWEEHGKRMVESVSENWAADVLPLIVYAEDFDVPEIKGIEVRRLPDWLTAFKDRWGKTPAYNGHRPYGYDYRFDAIKFSHKVAALTDAMLQITDGIGIWIDADTITHSQVTADWLVRLIPHDAYIAWLDRQNSHPECGFMMFRADHPYHHGFMESLRNLYTSGDLFKLAETHDSFAIWRTVQSKVLHKKIPPAASLSGNGRSTSHPAINGPLGACIDHCKGPRKKEGSSRRRDLIRPRPEQYWRGIS
jgi:hypothetical protein